MGLSKKKIGDLVEPVAIKCGIPQCEEVFGINIDKRFIPSRNVGADTSNYLVVPPEHFAFNLMHVGRDEKIPVALNDTKSNLIVSGAYFVFKITDEKTILKEYLRILMGSPEFDRYAWFCTDSSIRGNLDWDRFCDIEIELPPVPVQQKYVDVYNSMLANQKAYARGLDDLKLTCDAYIDELRHKLPHVPIGEYIEPAEARNINGELDAAAVVGLSTQKQIITTKADLIDVGLNSYKLFPPSHFAYVPDTSRCIFAGNLRIDILSDCIGEKG